MKVGIVHNSLNSTGGGERFCLKTIEALKEVGHKVVLATVEPTDWGRVERIMGGAVKPDEEVSLLNFKLRMFGIYMRLLTCFLAQRLRKQCDIVVNTHGDVLPIKADVVYMHYPTFALLKENSVNIKYSKSLFWRIYFTPYEGIQTLLTKGFLSGLVLTNSNFSKEAIRKYTGRNALVIYPPVDVEKFAVAAKSDERENVTVSCGRYSPEKNYEFVLKVAGKLRGARFIIVGASSGRISKEYYEKLSVMKKERGLDNVELFRDVPLTELLKLYEKAKIYLHTMRYEHFGISVVEAMAAGLVPVVHRSGGPWEDILKAQQGTHGFSYSTLNEAAEIIEELMENEHSRRKITERNIGYLRIFSSESFKKRILSMLDKESV